MFKWIICIIKEDIEKCYILFFIDRLGDWYEVIGNTEWRLDFACAESFCVEVAFNHGEAIAWNLLKPVLSCELNHVKKAVQGKIGIYVCATDKLKKAGNIDSASGSFEKVLRYIKPMMNQLTIPMMIIGLDEFETFKINKKLRLLIDYDMEKFLLSQQMKRSFKIKKYWGSLWVYKKKKCKLMMHWKYSKIKWN